MTHILLQAFLLQHPLDMPLLLTQRNHPQLLKARDGTPDYK